MDKNEDEHHVTLFPTRLREFEEKNNLVFQHYLTAKNELRRNSDTPYFGDQYVRRHSNVGLELEGDDEVLNAMKNIFRRTSIVDTSVKKVRKEVLETKMIPIIFAKLGQEYEVAELKKWIKGQDRHGLGVLDFDAYQRICVHFIKDPEAIERAKTIEFSLNKLIQNDSDEDEEYGDEQDEHPSDEDSSEPVSQNSSDE